MHKFIATLMVAGAIFVAAPTVSQAAPVHDAKVAASCVQTSFWGRLWALTFQRSYASYLWLNRC